MAKQEDEELVDHMLSWCDVVSKSSPNFRKKLVKKLLEGISEFDDELVKELDSSNYKLIGICPNVSYYRVSGENSKYQFVHPFGSPSLLYYVKNSPCLVITNPSLRYNSSVLDEIKLNDYKELVEGITG